MSRSSVDAQRVDPYKHFTFRVRWEGRYVAGVSKVGGLQGSGALLGRRDDGASGLIGGSPGSTQCEAITFERGVSHDRQFAAWAGNGGAGALGEAARENLRRDLIVEVCNEAGQPALAYKLRRCWVSEYQALPDLDGEAVAILHIKLENAGWERMRGVPEPAGRSLAPDDALGSREERA